MKLKKPDLKRCQAEKPNPEWSFMRLGPCAQMIRCENKPSTIATEKKKARDGLKGSMSLCPECTSVLLLQMPNHYNFTKLIKKSTKPTKAVK